MYNVQKWKVTGSNEVANYRICKNLSNSKYSSKNTSMVRKGCVRKPPFRCDRMK